MDEVFRGRVWCLFARSWRYRARFSVGGAIYCRATDAIGNTTGDSRARCVGSCVVPILEKVKNLMPPRADFAARPGRSSVSPSVKVAVADPGPPKNFMSATEGPSLQAINFIDEGGGRLA